MTSCSRVIWMQLNLLVVNSINRNVGLKTTDGRTLGEINDERKEVMKYWIIPCNIKSYDEIGAFQSLKSID